jgi:hypothetical protein
LNPDVEKAIPHLRELGIIPEEKATLLLRIAGSKLVSIYPEIRLLYYSGVLLVASGAGLLVAENYKSIGPLAVAVALGIAAAASLAAAFLKAAPFSWEETRSPSIWFDFSLLLGVLLASADLGFIEYQFTPLGANWPWHLLIVSLFMFCIAIRYDSRTVFSLALSTFAAWRGVSVSLIEKPLWQASMQSLRWNAIGCGVLFVLLARYLVRSQRKAHFEMVALSLGWLLILGALFAGCVQRGRHDLAYIALLALTGIGLAWHSFVRKRFLLFIFGMLGLYVALTVLVNKVGFGYPFDQIWIAIASLVLIGILWRTQKRMKEPL